MASKPTSVDLDGSTRERLDRLATAYDRERSWIINRAIQVYLDREEADRGVLIPHDDVMAEMDALIQDLARPGAKRG